MAKLKLSELTEATSKQNSDLLYIVQSGTSKSITVSNLLANANVQFSTNTTIVAEGANLYFTNARTIAALTAGANIVIDSNGMISTNIDVPSFDQDLNTSNNVAFARLSMSQGEITVGQGNAFNVFTTSDGNIVHQLSLSEAGRFEVSQYGMGYANLVFDNGGLTVNQINLGDGNTWVNQSGLESYGNITLTSFSGLGAGGSNPAWILGTNGVLTLPDTGGPSVIRSAGNTLELWSDANNNSGFQATRNGDTEIISTNSVIIRTDADGTEYEWTFGLDGDTEFPGDVIADNIVTKTNASSILVIGDAPLNRGHLYIRMIDVAGTSMMPQLKYSNPDNAVAVAASVNWVLSTPSPSVSGVNLWGGANILAANNDTWINLLPTAFTTAGDSATVLLSDHSFHNIYRVTVHARDIPNVGVGGSTYCSIEQLQNG